MNGNRDRRIDRLEEIEQAARPKPKPSKTLLLVYKDENVEEKTARYRRENGCDPAIIFKSPFTTLERGIKNKKGD